MLQELQRHSQYLNEELELQEEWEKHIRNSRIQDVSTIAKYWTQNPVYQRLVGGREAHTLDYMKQHAQSDID